MCDQSVNVCVQPRLECTSYHTIIFVSTRINYAQLQQHRRTHPLIRSVSDFTTHLYLFDAHVVIVFFDLLHLQVLRRLRSLGALKQVHEPLDVLRYCVIRLLLV